MDDDDDGRFYYNDQYPPLCIQASKEESKAWVARHLHGAITQYLQESNRSGIKDPNALLESGLTAGETGILHFRHSNGHGRRVERINLDSDKILDEISRALQHTMGIDMSAYEQTLRQYVHPDLFVNPKGYKRHLGPAIKQFLHGINCKPRGYTGPLKKMMVHVNGFIEAEIQANKKCQGTST